MYVHILLPFCLELHVPLRPVRHDHLHVSSDQQPAQGKAVYFCVSKLVFNKCTFFAVASLWGTHFIALVYLICVAHITQQNIFRYSLTFLSAQYKTHYFIDISIMEIFTYVYWGN